MEAHSHFGKTGNRSGLGIASRRSSLLVALISALLAGVLIYVFVSRYHKTTVAAPATETVFVAKQYIPLGTPDSSVASGGMLKPEVIPVGQAIAGAITDPSYITGEVSVASIAVGEQISATDFSHTAATLGSYLKGDERAIAVSFDSEHGITAYLSQGDTVDVIAQAKKGSEDLFQNISVLENSNGNVVLELTDRQSLLLTHALELGDSLWLTLRPISHATDSVRLGQIVGVN